jgi:hypothetical protein
MDPFDVEIAEDGRERGERMDRRADVVPEAGQRQLLRPHPTADPVRRLVHDHVEPRAR